MLIKKELFQEVSGVNVTRKLFKENLNTVEIGPYLLSICLLRWSFANNCLDYLIYDFNLIDTCRNWPNRL